MKLCRLFYKLPEYLQGINGNCRRCSLIHTPFFPSVCRETKRKRLSYGFTLIETLCVLFIIGLIAGFCLPQLKKLKVENEPAGDIGIICHTLKYARYHSITEKIPYQVSFSDEYITVNGVQQEEKFSHGTRVDSSNNPFWFYPTGRATPGEIACNERKIIITASGRLQIE